MGDERVMNGTSSLLLGPGALQAQVSCCSSTGQWSIDKPSHLACATFCRPLLALDHAGSAAYTLVLCPAAPQGLHPAPKPSSCTRHCRRCCCCSCQKLAITQLLACSLAPAVSVQLGLQCFRAGSAEGGTSLDVCVPGTAERQWAAGKCSVWRWTGSE